MGRGKVEMKLIEAKSSRQVTFSKRKGGLMKKARELSVLCDVEIGIIIFSGGGKLYEFASGDSLTQVLERYLAHKDAEVAVANNVDGNKKQTEHRGVNLLELVPRHLEEKNLEQLNMTQIVQLERQLYSILRQARNRKEKLMAEALVTLHQKRFALAQENREMRQQVAATSSEQGTPSQAAGAGPDVNNQATNGTSIGLAPPQGGFLF